MIYIIYYSEDTIMRLAMQRTYLFKEIQYTSDAFRRNSYATHTVIFIVNHRGRIALINPTTFTTHIRTLQTIFTTCTPFGVAVNFTITFNDI